MFPAVSKDPDRMLLLSLQQKEGNRVASHTSSVRERQRETETGRDGEKQRERENK